MLQAMTAGTAALVTGRSSGWIVRHRARCGRAVLPGRAHSHSPESTHACGHRGHRLSFSGRILHLDGSPVGGCKVEIWQCDANKVYHHPAVFDAAKADPNFLGFGAQVSDEVGAFSFMTIVPVATLAGRHTFTSSCGSWAETLTTQVYLFGMGGRAPDR